MNIGSTNVRRDNGDETSGFSGYFNWFVDVSSRSKFKTNLSTELTDTSSASLIEVSNPGNGSDVQVTTDVVRNSLFNVDYVRDDASLNTRVWIKYNKLTYSENPLDKEIRALGVNVNYPVTRLLSSGVYMNYNRNKQLESGRLDKRYTIGGNLRYNFSRKLHGLFDLKYRQNESTTVSQNYDEFSAFANLVYGFGSVSRPTRTGGY